MEHNSNIKSMKLYNHVDRVYNELKELGKNDSEPLLVEELTNFDQLHYYGTTAIDFAINKIGRLLSDLKINFLLERYPIKQVQIHNVGFHNTSSKFSKNIFQ